MESITEVKNNNKMLIDLKKLTDGEKIEMKKLGILSEDNKIVESVLRTIRSLNQFILPYTSNDLQ